MLAVSVLEKDFKPGSETTKPLRLTITPEAAKYKNC